MPSPGESPKSPSLSPGNGVNARLTSTQNPYKSTQAIGPQFMTRVFPLSALLSLLLACVPTTSTDKDSIGDTEVLQCRGDMVLQDGGTVVFTDFTINGLSTRPVVDHLCSTSDALTAQLLFDLDGELGVIDLQLSALGSWGPWNDELVELSAQAGSLNFARSDFYNATTTVSETREGYSTQIYGEATTTSGDQLMMEVYWEVATF